MISEAKLAQINKIKDQINDLVNSGSYYEALRLIVTLANRQQTAKHTEAALEIAFEGANSLLGKKQDTLGGQAANHYIELVEKAEYPILDVVPKILILFGGFQDKAFEFNTSHPKYQFMHEAIRVAQKQHNDKSSISDAEAALSQPLATWLYKVNLRALANNFYLRSNGVTEHSMKLVQWAKLGEATEIDLFVLRAVFQYLSIGKVASAKQTLLLFDKMFKSIEAYTTSPATHLAQLLVKSADVKSPALYNKLNEVYTLTILRDPNFRKYMTKVGEVIFGVQVRKGFLADLLSGQ